MFLTEQQKKQNIFPAVFLYEKTCFTIYIILSGKLHQDWICSCVKKSGGRGKWIPAAAFDCLCSCSEAR